MNLNRFCKGTLGSPATIYSALCGTTGNAKKFSEFGQATSDSTNSKNEIRSRVSGLVNTGCPAAIVGFIIPFIVDAIERFANRTFAHVFKKVLKFVPFLTNLNSSTSVVFVLRNMFISTPGTHTSPTSVSRSWSCDSMAVPDRCSVSFYQASTRLGCSTTNIGVQNNYVFTTIANTKAGTSVTARGINKIKSIFKNFKLSRSLSNDGYFGRHCIVFLSALFSSGRWAQTHARYDLAFSLQNVNP